MMRWMKLDDGTVINPNRISYITNVQQLSATKGFYIYFGGENDYVFFQGDEVRRNQFLEALQNRVREAATA